MTTEHYLISFHLDPHLVAHGYLMLGTGQESQRYVESAIERMESAGMHPWPPITLVTKLDTKGAGTVRRIIKAESREVSDMLGTATDFHFSAWVMTTDHPGNKRLMRMH